jgi:shikimate dehydrogenase
MSLYGLIGYPLTHSFSRKYFTEKFEGAGLTDHRYENFPIRSIAELSRVLKNHPDLRGLNITIPYKEEVIAFLTEASDVVRKVGACNCIRIDGSSLAGYNTDVTGFEKTFLAKLGPQHKKALVLGTGGAAKAVLFVLQKLGLSFQLVSRKPGVNRFSYDQLTPSIIREFQVIINTTPLGMFPNITELPPLPYQALTSNHYLYDLVYNPAKTGFLKRGEEQGALIHNGADMLVIQAEESWKIWNQ